MDKRLIDANKIEYENIYVYPTDNSNYKECVGKSAKIREAETVLTIPENPTNGDMIKVLFPDISITEIGGGATIVVANYYKFNSTWWNAPYTGQNKSEPEIGRMM